MKTILRVLTVVVFSFGLMLSSVFAQTSSTGTIEGNVTDSTGAVVPGVTVVVSGTNLIRPQSATTGDNGQYRVANLPPGKYSVIIESAKGFAKYEANDVEVNLSKSSSVAITLQAAGGVTTVDVVAGANIDQSSNVGGTNVTTEQFTNFPTQRTVQSIYTIAPTVARSGLRDASGRDRDPSVAGSSGPENNYILDGVNTTDPAFGGSGANLPFEFVQEVEVKTGAYGAEYGLATGGIFNVITKSGSNQFRGDAFIFYTGKSFVRNTKHLPFTGSASDGFSEYDAGFDIGGPIIKDKLWFFGAFNPQRRQNFFLTQTFRQSVSNKITTPFYSGKITYGINNNNTFNFSTFGDYTKQEGFLFGSSGFGADLNTFSGVQETGGTNYAFRLNSTFNQNFVAEFSVGLHRQRNNVIPAGNQLQTPLVADNFAVLGANGQVVTPTQSGVLATNTNVGFVDYVFSPGGSLQRGFLRQGFGLYQNQKRDRSELAARFQSIIKQHTFKYGFEAFRNKYDQNQLSTGPSNTFANPLNVGSSTGTGSTDNVVNGFRVTNNFSVCTTRSIGGVGTVVCPSGSATAAFNSLPTASRPAGFTADAITGSITQTEALRNPFLIRLSTRVRDFKLNAKTRTDVESFYVQDDIKVNNQVQVNLGLRWDYQQAYGNNNVKYLSLNSFIDNMAPRIGFIYDFTGKGKGKISANFARYVETPVPLDLNVRAGSMDSQTDRNFNVNRLNAPLNSAIATGFSTRNLGSSPTPIDPDLKPQTVNEFNLGAEYEVSKDLVVGVRGIYRAQGSVIEDGSFNDGDSYFLFNPGESLTDRLAALPPCTGAPGEVSINNDDGTVNTSGNCGGAGARFGHARRYYRALEFTATRRFNNNFSFITSYVYSSLTGNYEGLFRNDNGQSDPNITSLFDLVSLLKNTYGRLPNDRPNQFKFNGTYVTPFKLVVSGNFYVQSGSPFNQLTPHPVYGNNEGFAVPRGTAIIPDVTANGVANGNGGIQSSIGKNRLPTTFNLDMGFYYPIKFGEKRELRFTADIFNVLNSQRAITVDQTFSINSGVTGVAPVPNPFFGTGTIFQFPTSLRIGAKFRF
ncbi:MAG: TonB-dependent receptor domain-containing protein [Pyrinomonadaceae bacterium]